MNISPSKQKTRLIVYNLASDLDNSILATAHDWVVELSSHFEKVSVYSTHVGRFTYPSNVTVVETGGGNAYKRVRALMRLAVSMVQVTVHARESTVFHHQSPRTCLFPGAIFRILHIKQALWYSHSHAPISLRIASKIVNVIISSTENSFPLKSMKLVLVGHGVRVPILKPAQNAIRERKILFLGRIAPIKNIDKLVLEVGRTLDLRISIDICGPISIDSGAYLAELLFLARKNGVDLKYSPPVSHEEAILRMQNYKFFYSGMENSVDKSSIEAAMSGCLVLTTDRGVLTLTGMKDFWEEEDQVALTLEQQIRYLSELSEDQIFQASEFVSKIAIQRNNMTNTLGKIAEILKAES